MTTTITTTPPPASPPQTPFLASPILLKTGSTTPIYLTQYYYTDALASYTELTHPSISSVLISIPQPYTLAHAEYWIRAQLSDPSNPLPERQLPLQVIRAHYPDHRGLFIGAASLGARGRPALVGKVVDGVREGEGDGEGEEYEVGYHLHPDWRGMGIMGAAVRELVKWGTETYGVRAFVRVEVGNVASRKVVESMEGWERVEERDGMVDWPEAKGGGKRMLLFWMWKG